MSTRLVSKWLFYLLPLAILAGFAEGLAVPEGMGPGPHFGHAGSSGAADVLGWQVTSPVVGMGHGLTKPARVAPVPFAAAAGCRQVISDGGFERGASDVWRVGGPGIPSVVGHHCPLWRRGVRRDVLRSAWPLSRRMDGTFSK